MVVNAPEPAKPTQSTRKFVAWRLRLTKGAREASHAELESAENWLEVFEIVCGVMVFFGVAFEFFIAAENPPSGSMFERWGSSVADAFVALGVLGEVLASARGRIIQGELTRRSNEELSATRMLAIFADDGATAASAEAARALNELADAKRSLAEANERAANTELKAAEANERAAALERITARRTMEPGKRSQLILELKLLLAARTARVEWQSGDTEAWQLASEFAEVLRRADCVDVSGASNTILASPVFGLLIGSGDGVSIAPVLAAINAAGVLASPVLIPEYMLKQDADLGLYIFVGSKPPVALEEHFAKIMTQRAGERQA